MNKNNEKPTLSPPRIDNGEESCTLLTRKIDADFLTTDDRCAVPELQTLSQTKLTISPIVLKPLVKRDPLTRESALRKLEQAVETGTGLEHRSTEKPGTYSECPPSLIRSLQGDFAQPRPQWDGEFALDFF